MDRPKSGQSRTKPRRTHPLFYRLKAKPFEIKD
jgi:hypothetical protein